MVYDVKDFSELLNEYIILEKKIKSLSSKEQTDQIKQEIQDLKLKFGVKDRHIQALRKFYEDPYKLQAYFTGCAFITFKNQKIYKKVLKESKNQKFKEPINNANSLVRLKKKEKKVYSFIVKKAPEPTDIIWFNFVANYDGRKWFFLSLVLIFFVNIIFIVLFKLLKKAQHKYLDENEKINILIFGILHDYIIIMINIQII